MIDFEKLWRDFDSWASTVMALNYKPLITDSEEIITEDEKREKIQELVEAQLKEKSVRYHDCGNGLLAQEGNFDSDYKPTFSGLFIQDQAGSKSDE